MTAITVSRVSLPSGCCHVGLRPCLITTTLGSCVAVCLYDPVSALGGMNHFVLPRAPAGSGRDARFGDVAIGELVTKLEASGCRIADLTAKMFGGANAMWSDTDSLFATGPRNVALAREELTRLGIPILAERVGGQTGIYLEMESWSGAIRLRPIAKTMGSGA
jgi:chemotaxis protein CheD